MKTTNIILLLFLAIIGFTACEQDYLDVVPDNIATIDHAFRDEIQAKKYLATCYRYMPSVCDFGANPAMLGGDEFWVPDARWDRDFKYSVAAIARGLQNSNSPYGNYYKNLYEGIRQCNVLIERIDEVPNMTELERRRWKAEAQFLKAYYHFYLLRMYGPIPIVDKNLPVSADPTEVKFKRQPVDECFNYIVSQIDSTFAYLPPIIQNSKEELGRITLPIAKALKARVLILQASPLFNGNTDVLNFKGQFGIQYFPEYNNEKWKIAADACKEAIESAEAAGNRLYEYKDLLGSFDQEMLVRASLRRRVPERWNSEIIWGNTLDAYNSWRIQDWSQATLVPKVGTTTQALAVTFNVLDSYYTKNGLPVSEDPEWLGKDLMAFRKSVEADKNNIQVGEEIPEFHFEREPRFYADLGFDRGTWHWQGKLTTDDPYIVKCRQTEMSGQQTIWEYNITGFFCKKVCNPDNAFSGGNAYSIKTYAFPVIRLSDLYLAYAEALNEYYGPTEEVHTYVNLVRDRAGIPTINESYAMSNNPSKPSTIDGMREIIHNERLVELTFEGRRYWDLRRWKKAEQYLNHNVESWNTDKKNKAEFYTMVKYGTRIFKKRDYFWPFADEQISVNPNIDQNPGW